MIAGAMILLLSFIFFLIPKLGLIFNVCFMSLNFLFSLKGSHKSPGVGSMYGTFANLHECLVCIR